jgi:hypothetical protein
LGVPKKNGSGSARFEFSACPSRGWHGWWGGHHLSPVTPPLPIFYTPFPYINYYILVILVTVVKTLLLLSFSRHHYLPVTSFFTGDIVEADDFPGQWWRL